MAIKNMKNERRTRRKRGIRRRVRGNAERPRMTVTRSLNHIYVQIVDDDAGVTLCAAGSRDKELRDQIGYGGNVAAAKIVGTALAQHAKAKNITQVCFDRNGYRFHGRIKGLAEAAREGGLQF